MFHVQQDKKGCRQTGRQSRGKGSLVGVGVGAERESIKDDEKGGCARMAKVGSR